MLGLVCLTSTLSAQRAAKTPDKNKTPDVEIIYLDNPSFEDIPRAGIPPAGWNDCGQAGETPPDVQPYGGFRVTRTAQDGSTYLGLVTRDNNTWEGVTQRLSKPVRKGVQYTFSLYAARSAVYESATKRDPMRPINFDKAITVRVWAGSSPCDRSEMLGQSEVIDGLDWRWVQFKFTPLRKDYQFITIEAYYKTPTLVPYNGNILLDNASPIEEVPQEVTPPTPPVIAATDTPKEDTKRINPRSTERPVSTTTPSVKVDTQKTTPKIVKEESKGDFKADMSTKDLKVGQTFRLQNLYFRADSTNITRNSERTLDELYTFLKKNPNIVVEIGGHTNGLPTHEYCDKLSSDRAKHVADYLINKGTPSQQLQFKGYGKRKPIDSDKTEYGRQRNQRVEVKILEIK